jgi:hypothetical protein
MNESEELPPVPLFPRFFQPRIIELVDEVCEECGMRGDACKCDDEDDGVEI